MQCALRLEHAVEHSGFTLRQIGEGIRPRGERRARIFVEHRIIARRVDKRSPGVDGRGDPQSFRNLFPGRAAFDLRPQYAP